MMISFVWWNIYLFIYLFIFEFALTFYKIELLKYKS
jgi:hypothetical protein